MKRALLLIGVIALMIHAMSCSNKADQVAATWNEEFEREVGSRGNRHTVIQFLRERQLDPFIDTTHNLVTASRRDVDRGFLTTSGVYLSFSFDERGVLTRYEIKSIHTGP